MLQTLLPAEIARAVDGLLHDLAECSMFITNLSYAFGESCEAGLTERYSFEADFT